MRPLIFVSYRRDVSSALGRNIPIFPVLVDGARMPDSNDLPDELAPLTRIQGIPLLDIAFRGQIKSLIQHIENKLKADNKIGRAEPEEIRASREPGHVPNAAPARHG